MTENKRYIVDSDVPKEIQELNKKLNDLIKEFTEKGYLYLFMMIDKDESKLFMRTNSCPVCASEDLAQWIADNNVTHDFISEDNDTLH